jgi:hypothetical protein
MIAAVVAALAAAAPVTVGHGAVTAGPVLAGTRVLWADAPSGRPRVLTTGGVLASWPRAHTKDTGRTVAALAGSANRVAAVVETCTTKRIDDQVFLGCAERAFGGTAFAPFGRGLPARGPGYCSMPRAPVSVAAGDGVVAIAETPSCRVGQAARTRSRVVLLRGAVRHVIPAANATGVRIAGRHLAYLDDARPVRYDLRTGRRHRKRTSGVQGIDVQPDGRLALVRAKGHDLCASLGGRDLGCGLGESRIAAAGGRALFVRGRRLVLASAHGSRTLARGYFAGFDLARDRAVWAVGSPSGRQRIVVERL